MVKIIQVKKDVEFIPETSIRSYDKEGTIPYLSIIEAAQAHGTKRILFRVNPDKIDSIIPILSAKASMNVEKMKAKNGKEEFLFITLT